VKERVITTKHPMETKYVKNNLIITPVKRIDKCYQSPLYEMGFWLSSNVFSFCRVSLLYNKPSKNMVCNNENNQSYNSKCTNENNQK